MKKLVLSSKDDHEFIHPVCAMSYPNIYHMGSPANMSIKLSKDVDRTEIDRTIDENQICEICKVNTPRILKCKDYDKFRKAAHGYCILNMNKELIY